MGTRHADGGYSATVRINLHVAGRSLNVAQTGPDSVILRETIDVPPGTEAVLEIIIDGHSDRTNIVLPDGIVCNQEEVKYVRKKIQ